MVGENKKENSQTPTDVDSHSQILSDDGSKKNENSDPKSSSKSGSSKKGSSKGKPCCCCCGDQDSDDDERRDSKEDSKETIPKTVASPDPDQTESDKKIMTLEPVPSTSPPGSPADSAEETSPPAKQTPVEFDNFDPEPLLVKAADKDIAVLDALLIEADQDRKILEAPEKQTIPDPAVKEESNSDDGKNASFRADKLSVEGNAKMDRELLEKRKNSREGVMSVEDRPAEYLQLSKSKSKSESSSQTMSEEKKPELKSSGSDPKRPACVGYKWKMFSWFNKKKP